MANIDTEADHVGHFFVTTMHSGSLLSCAESLWADGLSCFGSPNNYKGCRILRGLSLQHINSHFIASTNICTRLVSPDTAWFCEELGVYILSEAIVCARNALAV